jgi:integrase
MASFPPALGFGLRVSEVANLKVSDIDSERMTLRVEQGKGQRACCLIPNHAHLILVHDARRAQMCVRSARRFRKAAL